MVTSRETSSSQWQKLPLDAKYFFDKLQVLLYFLQSTLFSCKQFHVIGAIDISYAILSVMKLIESLE